MKRSVLPVAAFCLLTGFLLGGIFPFPWSLRETVVLPPTPSALSNAPAAGTASVTDSSTQTEPSTLLPSDNFPLLNTACAVLHALKEEDYSQVASFVHPEKGVTFTPYSAVDPERDLTLSAAQIQGLAEDPQVYTWGFEDGRGDPIQMTIAQYVDRYVFNQDYTQASEIGIDQVMISGNALENLAAAYPGCRFVDFCIPGIDPANEGMDWCSLKLVFEPGESGWLLVGMVHGEWTI